jgi:hypothetical protein
MKSYTILVAALCFFSCKKEENIGFTFMKIGAPTKTAKSWEDNIGASVYIKLLPGNDSLFVQLSFMPDSEPENFIADSIIETYKIPNTPELQSAMDNFIQATKDLNSYDIPYNLHKEPVIYDGGTYLVSYEYKERTKYVYFVINNLSSSVENLLNKFMALARENKPSNAYKTKMKINTDSIAFSICKYINMPSSHFSPIIIASPPIRAEIRFEYPNESE